MSINKRARQIILCLFFFVGVFLLGVVPTYSTNAGLPNSPATQSQIVRGRYLVTITACADCHSPGQTPNDPYWMAGYLPGTPGQPFEVGSLKVYSSNLTPDAETGLGKWTSTQIFNSLRQGKHNDGDLLCPPMPWPYYRYMSNEDTWAIVAYLKSIKPVRNAVPEATASEVPASKHGGKHSDEHADCSIFYKNLKAMPPYPGQNELRVSATRR